MVRAVRPGRMRVTRAAPAAIDAAASPEASSCAGRHCGTGRRSKTTSARESPVLSPISDPRIAAGIDHVADHADAERHAHQRADRRANPCPPGLSTSSRLCARSVDVGVAKLAAHVARRHPRTSHVEFERDRGDASSRPRTTVTASQTALYTRCPRGRLTSTSARGGRAWQADRGQRESRCAQLRQEASRQEE